MAMVPNKTCTDDSAKLIGALFLLAFPAYGIGNWLLDTHLGIPIPNQPNNFSPVMGLLGFLLIVCNSQIVFALGLFVSNRLTPHSPLTANCYLIARVAEAFLLLLGAGALVWDAVSHVNLSNIDDLPLPLASEMGKQVNNFCFNAAMLSLCVGSLPVCWTLYRRAFVPRFLAIWGLIGYGALALGSAGSLAGFEPGYYASIPGGLFEITLGIWLISRGKRVFDYNHSKK